VIYLIKCGEFHKIGYTRASDATERLAGMRIGNPFEMTIVDSWPGSRKDEEALHLALSHKRHRGEWFALADVDLEWLASVKVAALENVPQPPRAAASVKFPADLCVEVEDVSCGWCGRWMLFKGGDSLYCVCGLEHPLSWYTNPARRIAIQRVMQKHALP
jgi:hypothetical protein